MVFRAVNKETHDIFRAVAYGLAANKETHDIFRAVT